MPRRSSLGPLALSSLLVSSCVVAAGMAACGGSDNDNSLFDSGAGGKDGSNGNNGNGSDGGSGNGNGDDGGFVLGDGSASGTVKALVFSPASAAVTIGTSASTANASFTLQATYLDGTTASVTPDSIEFDRPDLATIANGKPVTVTAPSALGVYGGTGTVHAIFDGMEATATFSVTVQDADYGTGLSGSSPGVGALGGSGLAADPSVTSLLYPYDQTVFPLGLTAPPVMWNAPAASDVYRLHFAEKYFQYDSYQTLSATPGSLRIPQAAWDRLTTSNDAKNGADPITFTLSRWDHASSTAYTSASETWTVAPASLAGAIYYWTTSNGGSLSRIPPGAGATPTPLTGPMNVNCMGCHAVSADGTTLVAALEGNGIPSGGDDSRSWVSFDLGDGGATVRKVSSSAAGNVAVSPDGKYVLGGDNTLTLSDSTTAAAITTVTAPLDTNMAGFHTPAFAPSGTLVAAVESGGNWQYWDYSKPVNSELVLLSFDPTAKTFGATAQKLSDSSGFTTGQNTINYPSFSPDSKAVAYQVADHNSGCWEYPDDCKTTTTEVGSIYLQSVSGGAPVRLANLSDPPVTADKNLALEPTFNPTQRGGYNWLVFSSERSWGNAVTGTADNDKKRLWVSAIDPVLGTVDPSHPAFFLEGQDTATQNMRGFWTVSACIATPAAGGTTTRFDPRPRPQVMDASSDGATTSDGGASGGACVNGFDCCSGFCSSGVCVDPSAIACIGLGGSCASSDDCCNASTGTVACTTGTCQAQNVR